MKQVAKIILLICISLIAGINLSAQYYNQRPEFLNANRIWIFGWQAGLDFNTTPPSAFLSPIIIGEGVSIACDPATGDLRFYSDGRMVRDRWHNIMPNGMGISGNNGSTTQGACIVPVPGDPDKYLLFSLEYENDPGRLYYSEIDLSLNGGLGDVVSSRKNIQLDSNLSEAMIAIPGDNCDIWLIVHTRTDPIFKAYRITTAGLNATPVISNTGQWPISGTRSSGIQTYHAFKYALMQAAPQRDRIAIATANFNHPAGPPGAPPITGVMLCRFDAALGTLSNPVLVADTPTSNISFSPDGNLLYLTKPDPANLASALFQYDISSYDSATIAASAVHIGNITNPYNPVNYHDTRMRLYNDTIYLSNFLSETLHRINYPDIRGAGCQLEINAISMASGTTPISGFPTDVVYTLPPDTLYIRHDTSICTDQTLSLRAAGNSQIRWDNGATTATRMISVPGSYYVFSKTDCHFSVDTFVVRFQPDDTTASVLADTIICNSSEAISLHAPDGFNTYVWNTGDTTSILNINPRGAYWVYAQKNCRVSIDTFFIGGSDLQFSLGEDRPICAGASLLLTIPADGMYAWQDGSREKTFTVTEPGRYTATVSDGVCFWSDTILISALDAPQSLGRDTSICRDKEIHLTLNANIPTGADVLWSNGSNESFIQVTDTGTYWIRVCQNTDTIRITREMCSCDIFIPTAFTPNGDGINDIFRPRATAECPVQQFRMNIYDRWGTLIYSSHSIADGWNGLVQGRPAEIGTYMYDILIESGTKGKQKNYKGDITLIR